MLRMLSLAIVVVAPSFALAQTVPEDDAPVRLQPARWRAVRQIVQECSEQAQFRWAMPDTLSRRAFVGTNDGTPQKASDMLKEVSRQTGITFEVIGDVVVGHVPKDDKRKELVEKLHGKDRRAGLQAACELGWLGDARALPALAKVLVGSDIELALAAAQALRKLEGSKQLDWRMHGVSGDDPELAVRPVDEFDDRVDPRIPGLGQVTVSAAFPNLNIEGGIHHLAKSDFLPLREAAIRLSIFYDLTSDLVPDSQSWLTRGNSPLIEISQMQAYMFSPEADPKKPQPKLFPLLKPDKSKWWHQGAPDLQEAAKELALNKDHDTVWRLTGRRVAYLGTPEAMKVMLDYGKSGSRWSPFAARALAEWCGGPEVIDWLRKSAVHTSEYGNDVGWSLWGLGALQDGQELAESLRPALLHEKSQWAAPPEFTAARGAGIYALDPILSRIERRGHWVCHALGYIGGPVAVEELIKRLDHPDAGVAIAAAKGLGDTGALAGVAPLIKQLQHPDRLRRHWAILGLKRIGGPAAMKALKEIYEKGDSAKERLVWMSAALALREISDYFATKESLAKFKERDAIYVPEYRPRNAKFDAAFPLNTEVVVKEFKPVTYCSIGETRAAYDWANKLAIRYGGCTGCYSNECFGFDVGTETWFPIRAADHFCHLFAEERPNGGCSRGMTFDGQNRWFWIGQGIGATTGPTGTTHNHSLGVAAYDAASDRFIPLVDNKTAMANAYSGEPAKAFAFDPDRHLVVGSTSGGKGIGVIHAQMKRNDTYITEILPAPADMPSWDQYRPPAFCYDPISQRLLCTHPDLKWKLLRYDFAKNAFQISPDAYPGKPNKQCMGGLTYDSLNQEMVLIGGIDRETKEPMPTCRYDRAADKWIDLKAENLGKMGLGQGTCVFDPEHNIIIEVISGAVYRLKNVPIGTKAIYQKR